MHADVHACTQQVFAPRSLQSVTTPKAGVLCFAARMQGPIFRALHLPSSVDVLLLQTVGGQVRDLGRQDIPPSCFMAAGHRALPDLQDLLHTQPFDSAVSSVSTASTHMHNCCSALESSNAYHQLSGDQCCCTPDPAGRQHLPG